MSLLKSRDTTKAYLGIQISDRPTLTDSALIALYECEKCFIIAIQSEYQIEKLTGLWEVEYYRRINTEERVEIYKRKYLEADSLMFVEREIGLGYAKKAGKEEKKKLFYKRLVTYGVPVAFVGGYILKPVVDVFLKELFSGL